MTKKSLFTVSEGESMTTTAGSLAGDGHLIRAVSESSHDPQVALRFQNAHPSPSLLLALSAYNFNIKYIVI